MDATDQALLATLQTDGRASYAELGRRVGLSGPSVQERVRRLEQQGVITGYRAVVPPVALGLGVTALIGIFLSDSASHSDVGNRLGDVEQIEDCWFTAGEEAYVLKVRARDVDDLERLLGRLAMVRGVARTRTTLVLKTRWEDRPYTPGGGAPSRGGVVTALVGLDDVRAAADPARRAGRADPTAAGVPGPVPASRCG